MLVNKNKKEKCERCHKKREVVSCNVSCNGVVVAEKEKLCLSCRNDLRFGGLKVVPESL